MTPTHPHLLTKPRATPEREKSGKTKEERFSGFLRRFEDPPSSSVEAIRT